MHISPAAIVGTVPVVTLGLNFALFVAKSRLTPADIFTADTLHTSCVAPAAARLTVDTAPPPLLVANIKLG
jgi:hypothetical protein